MRDYDIKSDLKQEQFQTLKLVQGDRGNKIKINVFEDGQPVNLTGCSITAKYKRSDGEIVNGTVENISGNSFDAVMDSDITKVSGTLKMIFSIEKDDVKVSTFLLLADVREGIGENTGSSGGSTGGGEVSVDLSNYYKKSETYSKAQIDSQFKDIANRIDNIVVTGGGLTTAQINALDNMFKVCAYTKNVSTEYNAFKTAFGIGTGTGGGDTPVEKTKYAITNNLTKVTTSNTATEIEEGSIYRANLTVDTSCRIDTITITMGGVDITSSCFTDNAIVINEVTGDIVITVVAKVTKVTAEDLGFTTLYEYDDIYDKDKAIASIGESGVVNYGYSDAVTVASYYYTVDNVSNAPRLVTFDGRRYGSITYNENGDGTENSKVKKLKDTIITSYSYKGTKSPKCYGCYTTGTNSGQINILSSQYKNIEQTTTVDVHVRILIIQGTDITAEQLCTIFGI